MRNCLIISGGDYQELPGELQNMDTACIIACDRGWQHAVKMGLAPDLVVGDFDSSREPAEWPVIKAPPRKDDTDTLLGIKEALSRRCKELHILCAFGGRLDHSIANLQAGAWGAVQGARVHLYGKNTRALVSGPGKLCLPPRPGWSLSLFALGEPVEGLTLKGTGYEGESLKLEAHFPLGVSNEWREETAKISWEKGTLVIMESKLSEGEHLG